MRPFLILLIVFEGLALLTAGGILLAAPDGLQKQHPPAQVFRPALPDAVIGDRVVYEKRDRESGATLAFLEFKVDLAREYRGTTIGREFTIHMAETPKQEGDVRTSGAARTRKIRVVPRLPNHGFLPPVFDEEIRANVPGEKPVIKRIATASVEIFRKTVPGFRIDTVVPRRSLTEVAESYWVSRQVPMFGVARFQTGKHEYVLYEMSRGKRS